MHIMALDFHNAMQIKVAFGENKVSIHSPCEALPAMKVLGIFVSTARIAYRE